MTTLNELDDISNLNQSIWVSIILQIFRNCNFECESSHMYCDVVVEPSIHVILDVGPVDYALRIL